MSLRKLVDSSVSDPTKEELRKFHSVMLDIQGRYRTASLFFEHSRISRDRVEPLFTVKSSHQEYEGKIYYSLKKIYLSYQHLPGFEYEFAMDVFGSWDHWEYLTEKAFHRNVFAEWRTELEIKIKAEATRRIMETAAFGEKDAVSAAKWLAEKGYMKDEHKRGRPTKAEVARERKVQAGIRDNLEADMERLGLTVVNGSK